MARTGERGQLARSSEGLTHRRAGILGIPSSCAHTAMPALDLVSAAASVSSAALLCDLSRPSNLSGLPLHLLEVGAITRLRVCWTSTTVKSLWTLGPIHQPLCSALVHLASVFWPQNGPEQVLGTQGHRKRRNTHRGEETKRAQCDRGSGQKGRCGLRTQRGRLLLVSGDHGRETEA